MQRVWTVWTKYSLEKPGVNRDFCISLKTNFNLILAAFGTGIVVIVLHRSKGIGAFW